MRWHRVVSENVISFLILHMTVSIVRSCGSRQQLSIIKVIIILNVDALPP